VPKKTRRKYSPEQKAVIVRRHLVDKVPVSDLCDEYGIQPSLFYNWQKAVLDNAERAFVADVGHSRAGREAQLEQKIAQLEAKLARKDSVIADISEEYVTLKKELGEP
jgi:transposase-like protein